MHIATLFRAGDGASIEAYCRAHVTSAYVGDHRAICRVLGNQLVMVDTTDLSVAPQLMLAGYWEMWVSLAMANYLQPGMRCIDVGANVGYFTVLMAALVGDDGFVQAWEPQADLVECLHATMAMNGYGKRTQLLQKAAGDEVRDLTLEVPAGFLGDARVAAPKQAGDESGVEEIRDYAITESAPLSCFWPDGDPPDLVKVDAEGFEPAVWAGLRPVLGDSTAVVMEFTPGRYSRPEGFLKQIAADGFRVQEVGPDGVLMPITHEQLLATAHFRMLWLDRA